MKFIYSKTIDKECWNRIKKMPVIFGVKIDYAVFPDFKKAIRVFKKQWTPAVEKEFLKGMARIFGRPFPVVTCYVNTTKYSMDKYPSYISISASRTAENFITAVCHEANHYMFRKCFPKTKNMEVAKEIFTVINNIYFQKIMKTPDRGYQKHWKQRYNFLEEYLSSIAKFR